MVDANSMRSEIRAHYTEELYLHLYTSIKGNMELMELQKNPVAKALYTWSQKNARNPQMCVKICPLWFRV